MNRRHLMAAAIAGSVLAVDQLTKAWALRALADGPVEIAPTVRLALFHNDGVSFSAGAGNGRLVGLLVVGAVLFLLWTMARLESSRSLYLLAIVLGGALGNLADRIFRAEDGFLTGHVVDFIHVTWFATFNIADACITVGIILFLVAELTRGRRASA